jgi:hypothetical protein
MRRRLLIIGPRVLLIAIAIVAGTTAGALAYWQGSGSGTATTVLANVRALSFAPGTSTASLHPGGEASVAIVVSNSNPEFIQIGSIILDPDAPEPFFVDPAHGGCDVSTLSFVTQDNGGAGWRIPPSAGTSDGTLAIDMPGAMKMGIAAADACQGATFTVQLEGRL